jgi:hypothetical protein
MKQDIRTSSLQSGAEPAGAVFDHWGTKYGPPLRVPARELEGERHEDKPCLTPIDCVLERRCAGHCGCR